MIGVSESDSDYYEDVLQNTETTYEVKKAAKEGNINMNLPGQKIRKVKTVGIGRGWGASAFFFKQVKEMHRHSPLVFWGGSTIMLAAVGAFYFHCDDELRGRRRTYVLQPDYDGRYHHVYLRAVFPQRGRPLEQGNDEAVFVYGSAKSL